MFNEPDENHEERVIDPAERAREKSDEFRIHAEVCAVFEGRRKFDAEIRPDLGGELARDIQKRVARMEKGKAPESPVLPPAEAAEAEGFFALLKSREVSPNDYHIHRRPGELMIVRWLEGDLVDAYYQRLQAHFDVALEGFREEERQALGWKQDKKTLAYLDALDALEVRMADRYLREVIRKHKVYVLSTLTADEMDILHLCDYVMGASAAEVVGEASAPPEEPTERDRAWFFKLFSLRGIHEEVEKMCFFAYLQKTEDTFGDSW